MRLDINLATRPYEDGREFWSRWGIAVGALGILTLALLGWAIQGWVEAGRDRHSIAQLQDQIATREKERVEAQTVLNQAANRATRDQSQLLNNLIQRKSFSWTRVMEDLERVMPANLHVVSLRPDINEQNQVELQMKVAGDNRNAAIELIHRMEGSQHFQSAQIVQESASSEAGSGVVASVSSIYLPEAPERSGR